MMIYRHKIVLTIILFMLTAACTVGCAGPATTVPTTRASTTASTTAASQNLNGAHVRVLGLWNGPELGSFMIVKAAWEKDTGGIVDWEGTQDLPEALTAGRKSARYRHPAQSGVDATLSHGREIGTAQLFYGHEPGQSGLRAGMDRPG
jgi:hypothetical protein